LLYGEDVPDGAVEKIAVVRDREQRAGIIAQPLLEPDHRIQIQVVGGFIEQQQVRAAHERARELQAHAPAAGEGVHRLLLLDCAESQSVHQAGGAIARGIAAGVLERFVQRGEALALVLFVRVRKLLLERAQGRIAIDDEFDRRLRARRDICATCATMSRPGSSRSPASWCNSPNSSANRLDLPQPFGPTTPIFCPACKVRSTPSSNSLLRARA